MLLHNLTQDHIKIFTLVVNSVLTTVHSFSLQTGAVLMTVWCLTDMQVQDEMRHIQWCELQEESYQKCDIRV